MSRRTAERRFPVTRILGDALGVLLLCALVVGFFWQIGPAGRVLAGGDIFTYFYPYWAEATRAIRAARLPLWNPYLFMGVPFLANSQVGFFYPFNWPLWLLFPAHRSVHLTIVCHLCLAVAAAYLWARTSLHTGRLGAAGVGLVFGLGGYLGAQVEHVNQLQGLAWFPLMLLAYDCVFTPCLNPSGRRSHAVRRGIAVAGLSAIIGLVLLAGHTQTAFISLVGLGIYGLGPPLLHGGGARRWRSLARRGAVLAGAAALGVMLAAVQLVPTAELSRHSIRAEGLPFKDRVSFSLSPTYLTRALLPSFGLEVIPEHLEHVAYVGMAGLILAGVALATFRRRSLVFGPQGASSRFLGSRSPSPAPGLRSVILLVCLGIFLSLGRYNPLYLLLARYVPGFAHFRVPARWLVLYVLGVAAMVGWGLESLWRRRGGLGRWRLAGVLVGLTGMTGWAIVGPRLGEGGRVAPSTVIGWIVATVLSLGLLALSRRVPRLTAVGLLGVLAGELFVAGLSLPYSRATAPQAFTSLRPAVAHLLAANQGEPVPSRFISMSNLTFDPGDKPEIELIYGPQLSADSLYAYIVAAKHKEVLSPALPLAFGLPAVDGYDGGVLPLARYVTLQRLFLPVDQVSIDGRLRENLETIPDARWLNLFDVRHVITDKLFDAWLDDVFYDLQFGASLAPGEGASVAHVPAFEATAVGLVSHLRNGGSLPDGAVVGVVEVGFGQTMTRTFELRAGEHTAEGIYGLDVAHSQAQVGGHFWPGQPEGNDYVARLRWSEAGRPTTVMVRATLPQGEVVVRGLSLIDERTGSFQALVVSDRGRFRLAHSGDVKIYENLDRPSRAFLVHRAVHAPDDASALASMLAPTFDPFRDVVLHDQSRGFTAMPADGEEQVRVTSYAAERIEIQVDGTAPGYLVVGDAWYPGWRATVDGCPVPLWRANLLFRAVPVDAGSHHVVLAYEPLSLRIGAGLSGLALIIIGFFPWTMGLSCAPLSKASRNAIMDAGQERQKKGGRG